MKSASERFHTQFMVEIPQCTEFDPSIKHTYAGCTLHSFPVLEARQSNNLVQMCRTVKCSDCAGFSSSLNNLMWTFGSHNTHTHTHTQYFLPYHTQNGHFIIQGLSLKGDKIRICLSVSMNACILQPHQRR